MTHLINIAKKNSFKFTQHPIFSVKKIIILPFVLCILAVTSGCNSSTEEGEVVKTLNDLASLQSAKTKWDSHSGQFYTIQSQRFCECVAEMSTQMKISVSDNSVLSAFDINSDEVISEEIQQEIKTVDSLFVLIAKAITDNVSIEVTYNQEYGYPEIAKVDLDQLAVDGGLHITLSDLEIKDSLLALDDVSWTLVSFDSIAGPQPVIENTNISLSIDIQNMQLSGVGGCNHYNADIVLDDANNNITISNVSSDASACEQPKNIMQQEQNYFATLAQIQFFTFDSATLNMVIGADAGLHFVTAQNSTKEPKVENPSNELASLQIAKKQWDSHSGQYYTIQSQRSCECEDQVSAQIEISVLDNSVLSAFDVVSGEVISKEIQQQIPTIDNLFVLIEKAITDNVSIEVIYNEEYGYPETAKIDLEKLAVDGGMHINFSNLEIKDSKLALDDVTWTLESFDSIAGPQPILENTNISLSFDMQNMQLNGVGGCNNYSADFVLDDKSHKITVSNIIMTEMACVEPDNIMQQEQNYLSILEQIRFFSFDNATLNMVVGGDAGLHFVVVN
jgi:heat shock protein HslJ